MENWVLPDGWDWRSLREIAPASAEKIRPSDYPDEVFNYWGLDSIESGQWQEPKPNLVDGSTTKSTCIMFDQSHVLYAKLRPYLNKVIVPSREGVGSTEWVPLQPDPDAISRKYLAYFLRNPDFVAYATKNSTGARMPRVRMSSLWETLVPLPYPNDPERSLAEQKRIVTHVEALLAEVAEARQLHQRIVEDTDRLMDAVLGEVFEELSRRWPEGQLGNEDLCQVIPGQHIMSSDYTRSPSGTPYITGPADFGDKFPIVSKWTQTPKVLSQPGDVLFTVKGSGVGKVNCAPTEEPCAIGRQIMALRPNQDRLTTDFLFHSLLGRFQEFQRLRQGAAIPGIRKEHVQEIVLPLPTVDVQRRTVAYVDKVRVEVGAMRAIQERDGHLLEQVERAILAQAFRGGL